MALGNNRFDSVRVGAFISINITPNVDLIVSGGYSGDTRHDSLNDDSGGYTNVRLRALF
jgi:hypothetical protein